MDEGFWSSWRSNDLSSRWAGIVCGKPQSHQQQQTWLENREIIYREVWDDTETIESREVEAQRRDNFGKVSWLFSALSIAGAFADSRYGQKAGNPGFTGSGMLLKADTPGDLVAETLRRLKHLASFYFKQLPNSWNLMEKSAKNPGGKVQRRSRVLSVLEHKDKSSRPIR